MSGQPVRPPGWSVLVSRRHMLHAALGLAALGLAGACRPITRPAPALPPSPALPPATAPLPTVVPLTANDSVGGPHVVFDLCIRDGACAEVCPVECIVPGNPVDEWPWYYVDPDTCINCGACVPECPVEAVLPAEDVPEQYRHAIELNARFFTEGPGYAALDYTASPLPVRPA